MSQQPSDRSVTVPVTEEELEVTRRTLDRTLRVRKEVQERPVQVQAESTVETVNVERVKVGRVVEEAPAVREEGDATVIPVLEERVVLVKQLVLVEEVRITRRRDVRTSTAETALRREQVTVERFDPENNEWRPEDDSRYP